MRWWWWSERVVKHEVRGGVGVGGAWCRQSRGVGGPEYVVPAPLTLPACAPSRPDVPHVCLCLVPGAGVCG